MKHMAKLSFLHSLVQEARRQDLEYKEEKTKGVVDKVIVALEGAESGAATKLAKRFTTLSKAIKTMEARQKELNAQLSGLVDGLFDEATDIAVTRVVKTASFTLTLSKQEETKEKVEVNYAKLYEGIAKLISEELQPKVDELIEANTKRWMPAQKKSMLRVKELEEGKISNFVSSSVSAVVDKLKSFAKELTTSLKTWGRTYDAKLKELQRQAGIKKLTTESKEVKVGWYVEDIKDRLVAGPMSEVEAKKKAKELGGDAKGYTATYVSDYASRRMSESRTLAEAKLAVDYKGAFALVVSDNHDELLAIVGDEAWGDEDDVREFARRTGQIAGMINYAGDVDDLSFDIWDMNDKRCFTPGYTQQLLKHPIITMGDRVSEAKEYDSSADFDAAVSDVEKNIKAVLKTVKSAEWKDWMNASASNYGTASPAKSKELVAALTKAQQVLDDLYDELTKVS
jgi:hypothetical protein